MNTPLPLKKSDSLPLLSDAQKSIEIIDTQAKHACAQLTHAGERYRAARKESLEDHYDFQLSALQRKERREPFLPDNDIAAEQVAHSQESISDPDEYQRALNLKKETFARGMMEREQQRQELQRARKDEIEDLLRREKVPALNADKMFDLGGESFDDGSSPGFLRRLDPRRLFWERK